MWLQKVHRGGGRGQEKRQQHLALYNRLAQLLYTSAHFAHTHTNTCILHNSHIAFRVWITWGWGGESRRRHGKLTEGFRNNLKRRFLSSGSSPPISFLFFPFKIPQSNIYLAPDYKHLADGGSLHSGRLFSKSHSSWKYHAHPPTWPCQVRSAGKRERKRKKGARPDSDTQREKETTRSWGLMAFPSLW